MFKIFVAGLFLMFSMVGISECIHSLIARILKPSVLPQKTLLVVLNENHAEQQLESIINEYFWYGGNYAGKIKADVSMLSANEIEICKLRFNYDFLIYFNSNNL